MHSLINKVDFPPKIATERTIIQLTKREDLTAFKKWPPYPRPFEPLSMVRGHKSVKQDGCWWGKIDAEDRVHYTIFQSATKQVIGMHAFLNIDWENNVVGNMGIRIHPLLCGQHYGQETLTPLLKAVIGSGMKKIRLDVAATNYRAVRCCQNCGMKVVSEFWQEHTGEPIRADDPIYTPLMVHFKQAENKCLVRFYWMEF